VRTTQLTDRLQELAALNDGWNGPASKAIRADAIRTAEATVREIGARNPNFHEPSVVPKGDGFVQLEWESGDWGLEMELLPEGWEILGESPLGGKPTFHTAEIALGDWEALAKAYRWWAGREARWPF
jgi:hypothetical protein